MNIDYEKIFNDKFEVDKILTDGGYFENIASKIWHEVMENYNGKDFQAQIVAVCHDGLAITHMQGDTHEKRVEHLHEVGRILGEKNFRLYGAFIIADTLYSQVEKPEDFEKWTKDEQMKYLEENRKVDKKNEAILLTGMTLSKFTACKMALVKRVKGKKGFKLEEMTDGYGEDALIPHLLHAYTQSYASSGNLKNLIDETIEGLENRK